MANNKCKTAKPIHIAPENKRKVVGCFSIMATMPGVAANDKPRVVIRFDTAAEKMCI